MIIIHLTNLTTQNMKNKIKEILSELDYIELTLLLVFFLCISTAMFLFYNL
jgi:hypothetical protein